MKMMLWKEWRESIRWMPIPLVVFSVLLWMAMPSPGAESAGFTEDIATIWAIAASIAACLIGVLQTLGESRTDARGLLLCRPVWRNHVFLAKTIVAAGIYGLSLGIPLLVASIWIAAVAPQTRAGDPVQMMAGVIVGIGSFGFHPAACWMVSRPASWVGTRTLPLVIAGVISFAAFVVVMAVPSWGWLLFATLMLVGSIALLYLSARHAFTQLTNLPPIGESRSSFKPASGLLLIACLIVVTTAGVMIVSSWPALQTRHADYVGTNLRVDEQGEIYNTTEKSRYDNTKSENVTTILSASPAAMIPTGDPLPDVPPLQPYADQSLEAGTAFMSVDGWFQSVLSPFDRWPVQIGRYKAVYHRDGYYLLYDPTSQRLHARLTRAGVGEGGPRFDGPSPTTFAIQLLREWKLPDLNRPSLMIDRQGIYQLGEDNRSLRTLLEYPIESAAFIPPSSDHPPRLWLHSGEEVTLLQLSSIDPDNPLPRGNKMDQRENLPQIELTRLRTLHLGKSPSNRLFVADRQPHGTVFLSNINFARTHYYRFESGSRSVSEGDLALFNSPSDKLDANVIVDAIFPPLMMMVAGAVESVDRSFFDGGLIRLTSRKVGFAMLLLVTLHSLIAVVVTAWASRRRHLGRRTTILWAVTSAFLGLATALAVLAIYPRIVCESCPECGADVRVDHDKCPACGVAWELPPRAGYEILEDERVPKIDPSPIAKSSRHAPS